VKFGAGSEGAKPEPKGALAALVTSAPSSDPLAAEPETDHGFRAVAKAFGIPPEREASAQAALKQYIKTCTASAEEPELEEGY
jgi:hypothetical protein